MTEYPRMLFRALDDGGEDTIIVHDADEKAAKLRAGWTIKPLAWLGEVAPAAEPVDEAPVESEPVKRGRKPKE